MLAFQRGSQAAVLSTADDADHAPARLPGIHRCRPGVHHRLALACWRRQGRRARTACAARAVSALRRVSAARQPSAAGRAAPRAVVQVHHPGAAGDACIAQLFDKYADQDPDRADLALVWLAETALGNRIATLDVADISDDRIKGRWRFEVALLA